MKKKNETILFLGAGRIQVPAIQSAKKLGYKIVGIDKNKLSSGKKLCDYFFNIDSNNVNLIYKKIKKIKNVKFISIWANNDILLLSKSLLEKKLNIKSLNTYTKTKSLLDKSKFKKTIKRSPLLIKKTSKYKFPIIAKPHTGSGSRGIKLIHNNNQLEKIDQKKFIFENYIKNGTEYGINFYRTKKKIIHLPSVKRFFDHKITFSPLGTIITNKKIKNIDKINELLINLIKKLKLYGQIKFDLIINSNIAKIFEVSPRFHGEIDTTYLFNYANSSLAEFYFKQLKNNQLPIKIKKITNNYGYVCIYNDKISKKIVLRDFKKFNLKLKKILKRDNYNKKNISAPQSTNDIFAYAFFETKNNLTKKKFIKLSKHINKF